MAIRMFEYGMQIGMEQNSIAGEFIGQLFILPGEDGKMYPTRRFERENKWSEIAENLE